MIRRPARFKRLRLAACSLFLLLAAWADSPFVVKFDQPIPDGVSPNQYHQPGSATLIPDGKGGFHRSGNGYLAMKEDGSRLVIPADFVDAKRLEAAAPVTLGASSNQSAASCVVRSTVPKVELPELGNPAPPNSTQASNQAPSVDPVAGGTDSAAPTASTAATPPATATGDYGVASPTYASGGGAGGSSGLRSNGRSPIYRNPSLFLGQRAGSGGSAGPIRVSEAPLTGRAPASASSLAPTTTQILPQIRQAANELQGEELVREATRAQRQLQQDALSDYSNLRDAAREEMREQSKFTETPLAAAENVLRKAQDNLQGFVSAMEGAKSSLHDGNQNAMLLPLRNARDKVALALSDLGEERNSGNFLGTLPSNPFRQLSQVGPTGGGNPLAISPALKAIFDQSPNLSNSTSPDALVDRTIFLAGLSPLQRAKLSKSLKLLELAKFTDAAGKESTVPILHNGYILGSSKSGIDCSAFVSKLLPPQLRHHRFTTLDFWAIFQRKQEGSLPRPPAYPPAHAIKLEQAADAFDAIDIYKGGQLMVGDLLVYRLPWDPIGHVFLVKSYNPRKQMAEVIEAAQSAGTIREREFPLTINPTSTILRPGLMGLRIKPVDNAVCQYKDSKANRKSASGKGGAR